jgi:hypothetical protein
MKNWRPYIFHIKGILYSFQNLVILNDQNHELLEISGCHFFSRAHIWHLQGVCRNGSQFSCFKFFGFDAYDGRLLSSHIWSNLEAFYVIHVKGRPYSGCSGVEASSFSWGRWVGGWGRMAARPVPPTAGCAGTSRLRVKGTESRCNYKICTPCPPSCPPPHTPHLPP